MWEIINYWYVCFITTYDWDKYMMRHENYDVFFKAIEKNRFVQIWDDTIACSSIKKIEKKQSSDILSYIFSFEADKRKELLSIIQERETAWMKTKSIEHLKTIAEKRWIIV